MPRAILLGCVLLGCVGADIVVSRTVDALTIGKLNLTVAPGCTAHDEWGSSACDLNWGSTYTVYASGALTQDIVAGSTITIDAKLDGFVPLHLTCPACGANCSVTIPIVKKHLHWTMPDCPISSGKLPFTKTYTLPSSSPVPLKIGATGTATLTGPNGNTLAQLTITGKVSPQAEADVAVVDPFLRI